jgi:hypothetical protein
MIHALSQLNCGLDRLNTVFSTAVSLPTLDVIEHRMASIARGEQRPYFLLAQDLRILHVVDARCRFPAGNAFVMVILKAEFPLVCPFSGMDVNFVRR